MCGEEIYQLLSSGLCFLLGQIGKNLDKEGILYSALKIKTILETPYLEGYDIRTEVSVKMTRLQLVQHFRKNR